MRGFLIIFMVFCLESAWSRELHRRMYINNNVHKAEHSLPVCPPDEHGEIILYPKPENCSEFYQCANGYLYTHVCGPDLYYCAAKERCEYSYSCDFSNCKMNPTLNNKQMLKFEEKADVPKSRNTVPSCPPDEHGEIILYPKPENCSEFYQCANGYIYTHVCGPDLYYCAAKERCEYSYSCDFSNCKMNSTLNNKQTLKFEEKADVPKSRNTVPSCPPDEHGEIILYPKPENCSEFYQCANGYLYTQVCGPDLYYCAAKERCEYSYSCDFSNCKMNPTLNNKQTLKFEEKADVPKSRNTVPSCPPDEHGEIILYPKPENCSEFYQCANGYLYTHVCGPDLYYCAAKERCEYSYSCDFSNCKMNPILNNKQTLKFEEKADVPKSRNSVPSCPPDEHGEIILYPKPENCSEFYQCANGYLYTHVCGPDLYYCAAKERCEYSYSCDFSNCEMKSLFKK
ncbi:uncharacterized protein [Periplaneta americana]|uniref:uncharacterized protein n=1 Tax=Periplaneta americana TaxID=6978 RepID=UPI0037E8213A